MAALPQTSRVKFMDDLEGHFCYLDFLLKSNSNASTHPVSEEQSKQNICRERKIFVKAALQLLDAQEKNVVNSLIVPSLIAADNDFEIIRSGYLKKGTRVSKMIPNMGLSHSKSSYTWKTKYVELRHGEFSYYDETVEETPLMTASLHSYHSQSHSKGGPHAANTGGGGPPGPGGVAGAPLTSFKKSIPLSPDLCSCRVVQYANGRGPPYPSHQSTSERDERDGIEERDFPLPVVPTTPSSDSHFVPSHAFELCLLGGQRRLFLTGSAEESREWVKDILTAMVGGKSLTLEPPPSDRKPSIPAEASAKSVSTTARMKMQEGGAGPYAGAITEYLNLQARLHAVREEEGYKSIMRELVDRRARVVVPVAYIKGKCSDNSFLGASAHLSAPTVYTHHHDHLLPSSLSINALLSGKHRHHTGNKSHAKNVPPAAAPHGPAASKGALAAVCVERSQMWKDLQRDEVCVNGECVAGASSDGFPLGNVSHGDATEVSQGAEAIVGLLVRHIADAVDKAKAELQSMLLKSQPHTPHASHHVLLQVMTEAQIVQCARSVLMMCNRTQSGGDTYYCVDTLLRRKSAAEPEGHNNNNLFILAPMSNKADPLTIEVDLVETDRSGFDPEGGGSRLQMQQKAAAFATPMGGGPNNTSILLDHSPRTDFIDALAATSLNSNGQASPAVLRTGTTDTADGDALKRRSSRRMHLKLSIDEDVDFYEKERSSSFSLYADAATPLAAVKVLRSEFVSILEENSSHHSDTTDDRNQYPHRRTHDGNLTVSLSSDSRSEDGPGGRSLLAAPSQEDGPPLRVLSIDEGALHDESGDVDINGSSNNTPPYLISGRDDSTVISDITFDTTAAFSQHTTVASYHQQTRDVALGCAADPELTEMASPSRPGKKSHHLKGGKALMKMISSRTKHTLGFTPGGSHAHNFSDQDLHASAAAAAASTGDEAPGTAPTDLRPSYSSFGSLQTMTPGRSRNGSSADGASNNNNNNTGGGGNMLSSLFKSERNKTANKTNNASELAQSADAARGGMRNGEREKEGGAEKYGEKAAAEKKACVCVRLRVRGVSRYRVCSADPQGDPAEDNWAAMEGAFSQTFFVPAAVEGDFPALSPEEEAAAQTYGPLPASAMVLAAPVPAVLSRLAMTDRVVVISALKCES